MDALALVLGVAAELAPTGARQVRAVTHKTAMPVAASTVDVAAYRAFLRDGQAGGVRAAGLQMVRGAQAHTAGTACQHRHAGRECPVCCLPKQCAEVTERLWPRHHRRANPHRGSVLLPIRNASTSRAACRPSRIAQTTSDWPRRMSPAANTLSTLVR